MVELIIDHIVSDPEKRGGRPLIKGTGITVQNIIEDINDGMTPDEIAEAFDLTLGQIHAALSYYYDHVDKIDQAIEISKKTAETIKDKYGEATQEAVARIKTRLGK